MTFNKKTEEMYWIFPFTIILISVVLIGTAVNQKNNQIKIPSILNQEPVLVNITCESNSMGLLMPCNSKASVIPYKNELLHLGRIYVYEVNSTYFIIHRLVGCVDKDCNRTIFKGDNNLISELINKSQIKYIVTAINFY